MLEVPWEEASRFGILATDENNRIYEFAEKPKEPKSNKASMGVYVFSWDKLKNILFKMKTPRVHQTTSVKTLFLQCLKQMRGFLLFRLQDIGKM